MENSRSIKFIKRSILIKIFLSLFTLGILGYSWLEFEQIAWGTGTWLGELSLNWALILTGFTLFTLLSLAVSLVGIWDARQLKRTVGNITKVREALGAFRWVLVSLVLVWPVWLLQYTAWGVVIHKPFLRLEIWMLSVLLLGVLFTRGRSLIEWGGFVMGSVMSAGVVVMAVPLQGVTDYPFSLGWSEGNRLWDYSILFGRDLYDYPLDKSIPVLLDIGRQFVGGLVFLLPNVSILEARLWVAMTYILPYLVLGWMAFKLPSSQPVTWLLAGLWGYSFLNQGPIHPPLVVIAILVALAWKKPLWIAILLIVIASYFAQVSRWMWMFAPGLWSGMLELTSATAEGKVIKGRDWFRTLVIGSSGLVGVYILPVVVTGFINQLENLSRYWGNEPSISGLGTITTISSIISETVSQPLLWYRLLPNSTYGTGIITGLLIATFPLIILLLYLLSNRIVKLNNWQTLAIILPLVAFLVVGLTISVKIGGGGDLHNMDMFIIGLLFTGAICWRKGGGIWIQQPPRKFWLALVMIFAIGIPAFQPLLQLAPLTYAEEMNWVMTLRDDHSRSIIDGSLPTEGEINHALEVIEQDIAIAKGYGEILFIDQRQLLTFGYIRDIPLVPEYDKKVLINEAMSGSKQYFDRFNKDLASKRFSLIISERLGDRIKDSSYQFGEENNAWVKWVAAPILCYYEVSKTLNEVKIQLLVPRSESKDCSAILPK